MDWDAFSENSVLFDPLYFLVHALDYLIMENTNFDLDRIRRVTSILFTPYLDDPSFGDIFAHRQSLLPYWQALLIHLRRMWGSGVVFDGYRKLIDSYAVALSEFLVSLRRN